MKLRSIVAAAITVTVALSACDSGSAEPATPSDLSTPVATVAVTLAPSSSSSPSTPLADTTTSESTTTVATVPPTVPAGSPVLSADGPWTLVDSAPGINSVGLIYELMPKLWVFLPTQEDRANGYFWTFNELDRPAIEGYLKAMMTRYRSTDSVPATLDDEGWDLYYTPAGAAESRASYQLRADAGVYTDLDLGVVLRPSVIEDNRTETYTIVMDCELDGAVLRNADGTYADGATPGVIITGYAAGMRLVDGSWKMDGLSQSDFACR